MNHAARCELDAQHRCSCWDASCAPDAADVVPLHDALQAATQRRLRRLLMLGGTRRVAVTVVPLRAPGDHVPGQPQLSLGKRQVCGGLGVTMVCAATA